MAGVAAAGGPVPWHLVVQQLHLVDPQVLEGHQEAQVAELKCIKQIIKGKASLNGWQNVTQKLIKKNNLERCNDKKWSKEGKSGTPT